MNATLILLAIILVLVMVVPERNPLAIAFARDSLPMFDNLGYSPSEVERIWK